MSDPSPISPYALESLRWVMAVNGPLLAWASWPLLDRTNRIVACVAAATGIGSLFPQSNILLAFASIFVACFAHCLLRIRQARSNPGKEYIVFDLFAPMTTNTSRRIDQREFIDRHSTVVLYIPPGITPAGVTPEVRSFLEQYRIAPGLYSVMLNNLAMHIIDSSGLYAYILGSSHTRAVEDFATLLKISEGEDDTRPSPPPIQVHSEPDPAPASPSPSPSQHRSPLFTDPVQVTPTQEGDVKLNSFGPPSTPSEP